LTRLSLANRLIVALISIAIVVFGVLATRSLKQELLPSTQVPTAVVPALAGDVHDLAGLRRIGELLAGAH